MIEKSTIPRCRHGMYSPDGDGKDSEYCYGCKPPIPIGDEEKRRYSSKFSPYPYGSKKCPECSSNKFRYKNDWDFKCEDCGFNPLT